MTVPPPSSGLGALRLRVLPVHPLLADLNAFKSHPRPEEQPSRVAFFARDVKFARPIEEDRGGKKGADHAARRCGEGSVC